MRCAPMLAAAGEAVNSGRRAQGAAVSRTLLVKVCAWIGLSGLFPDNRIMFRVAAPDAIKAFAPRLFR
jgi:hypothetical protein